MATLSQVYIKNYRCFKEQVVSFKEPISWFVGNNGVGKSSLLEAITIAGRTKSSESLPRSTVIRDGSKSSIVRVKGSSNQNESFVVGVELTSQEKKVRANGEPLSRIDAASLLPFVHLSKKNYSLVDVEAGFRRSMIDWCLFHVEQSQYQQLWNTYNKALRNRNAALRTNSSDELVSAWDQALLESGELLSKLRTSVVKEISLNLVGLIERLDLDVDYQLRSKSGYGEDQPLSIMFDRIARDRKKGYTELGPHRMDWFVISKGKDTKRRLSNGQKKLLSLLIVASQIEYVEQRVSNKAILLLDDLAAELDQATIQLLMDYYRESERQILLTSIEAPIQAMDKVNLFHVKQLPEASEIQEL